jgi:hypothetical protein
MLALLAQAGGNKNDEVERAVLLGACCGLAVWLVVVIFFLISLSKALHRCHPRNRTMEPGQVWLNLIPLFNIVWQFVTVNRVADSLRNEFYDRRWDRGDTDYGRGVGTVYCVLNPVVGVLNAASNVEPVLALVVVPLALVALICFIIYWVKIANFSGQLVARPGDYDDYDDYEDDEPDDEPDDRGDRRDDRDRRDKPRGEYDDGYEDRPWERR